MQAHASPCLEAAITVQVRLPGGRPARPARQNHALLRLPLLRGFVFTLLAVFVSLRDRRLRDGPLPGRGPLCTGGNDSQGRGASCKQGCQPERHRAEVRRGALPLVQFARGSPVVYHRARHCSNERLSAPLMDGRQSGRPC